MLTVIEEAAKRVGGVPELARRLGVTRQAIYQWSEVPLERVAELASATGLAKGAFRPDVFDEGTTKVSYESDFHAWADRQAQLIEAGRFSEIDTQNLLEEIRDMAKRDKRAIQSNLKVVLAHLLKWVYQPSKRSPSWQDSIDEGRECIEDEIKDSPSLKSYPAEVLATAYMRAVRAAARQTRLPLGTFPAACPFTIEQVLDPAFPADLMEGLTDPRRVIP